MSLPRELSEALGGFLAAFSPKEITVSAQKLSTRYRLEYGRTRIFVRGAGDVAAYAAYRLPATFATARAVFDEIRDRRPNFRPRSMLDIGAGPGTAAWAATEVWPDLEHIALLERDRAMLGLGKALAARSSSNVLRDADWRQVDLTGPWEADRSDLVVAAYTLGELSEDDRTRNLARITECTGDVCSVIEPGTPGGFAVVARSQEILVGTGCEVLAPFPAGWSCLDSESDWHHFSVRVPRTRLHRQIKTAALAYEDEKYSYVACARLSGVPIAARVVRRPQIRPGHVRLVLCTEQGPRHLVVTRSDRAAFRAARHLRCGSAISLHDAPLFGLLL